MPGSILNVFYASIIQSSQYSMKYCPPFQREAINDINSVLSIWLFLRDHWPSIQFSDGRYICIAKGDVSFNLVWSFFSRPPPNFFKSALNSILFTIFHFETLIFVWQFPFRSSHFYLLSY